MTPIDLHKIILDSGLPEPWPCGLLKGELRESTWPWVNTDRAVRVFTTAEAAALFEVAFMDAFAKANFTVRVAPPAFRGLNRLPFRATLWNQDESLVENGFGDSRLEALAALHKAMQAKEKHDAQ